MTRPVGATMVAVGIVALEFSIAVSTFVSSTLLPTVAGDLHAHGHLGLLLAGSILGLFVALPLASRLLRGIGTARTLTFGLLGYVVGALAAATSRTAVVFAVGQFVGGFASGLLAVFGISSVIKYLDYDLRVRVVAASSAMWILPAMVGPAATLALEHAFGWRWTLLAPMPIVLVGRLLVARAVRGGDSDDARSRPLLRTLLVPVGVAALVLAGGHASWWPIAVAGVAVAVVGVGTIMPPGTIRLARGVPAALGALTLYAVGYFGADSLITVLLTDSYHASLARAAIVLSAAPLAWAVTSLLLPRIVRDRRSPPASVGLALGACGVLALSLTLLVSTSFAAALIAWTVGGIGIGLAYPSMYLICTSTDRAGGLDATELATAVITAEAFGGLLGRATGGAVIAAGPIVTYALFAAFLFAAAVAVRRS
ncbi:MAG TPA: MFS transporter [Pseudonocardiaceae bacterium]|jgi:MFS family permease|nr:MFS transporter [Pseudonocardiaceae bacterium]